MRVGLLGLGEAGFTIHLPALAQVRSATIVAAADPDPDRRARASSRFGVTVVESLDDLLATRPDVVIVASPPHTHADVCIRSLGAGAHVLCEKPFVSSVAEADRVLAAAAAAGRQAAVNHQFRRMPIFRALIEQAAQTPVRFAQIWQLMNQPPAAESGWRGALAHRTLFEAGVHLVDFAVGLMGSWPAGVQATMSSDGGQALDAVVLATLDFPDGRLVHIVQNRICKGPMQYFEVRAETADASLRASFGGRSRVSAGLYRTRTPHVRVDFGWSGLAWAERGNERRALARNPKQPMVDAAAGVLRDTLTAFAAGGHPPTPGEEAREVLRVIAACYRSADTGRRIVVDARDGALASQLMGAAAQPRSE